MLKIYRSLKEMSQDNKNASCFNCYIKDINVKVQLFANCLYITDLSNALKRGKECRKTVITYSDLTPENLIVELNTKYLYPNKKDLSDLIKDIQDLKISDLQEAGFDVELREEKASTVFSPFANVQPIKLPKNGKWTKSHVVKAILAGQIYEGKINSIYTDDYAYDNATNCHENENLNLMEMAQKLVESSNGWAVRLKEENNSNIALSVNCCTFNYNTLYFNIDSRKDNIEYVEVTKEDIQDQTFIINNPVAVTENIDTNSNVINLFAYKKQRQNKQQELFNKLLSCNSLEEFKYSTEKYLHDTEQKYIVVSNTLSNEIMNKLHNLANGDLIKMLTCFDILKYFPTDEDLKRRNIK